MEKNLFMVWVGNDIPKYALHSFNAFKEMNPSFSCDFVHCEIGKLGEWRDKLHNYSVRGCYDLAKCVETDDAWHRCMLSNLIRYWLIQTHGGIYADCDMFPIRPLDELSEIERPFRITKKKPHEKFITDDINFMGCRKGEEAQHRPVLLHPIKLYDFNDPRYVAMRDRFFSCSLNIGEHYNDPETCYVDHYDSNTYGRNKQNADGAKTE